MRVLVVVAAASLLLAGCGGGGGNSATPTRTDPASGEPRPGASQPASPPSKSADPWQDSTAPAQAAGKVGVKSGPCQLPATFDMAQAWVAKAITDPVDQGGATAKCDVDAKPAGQIGMIRVWVAAKPGLAAKAALENFVAASPKAAHVQYRDAMVGPISGTEVVWAAGEDAAAKRAFAVATPRQVIIVSLGGLDTEEYTRMLPAYLLAKQSFTLTER